MANGNPQVEDGFTRIANELFDAVLRAPLTGVEQKVVLAVIRLTYGYNKREDTLSFSQIAAVTGIGRQSIVRAMVRLRKANVLTSKPTGRYSPSVWAVQKRYQSWALSSTEAGTATASETSTEAGTSTAQDTKTSTRQGTTTSTATGTHQRQGKTVKTGESANALSGERPTTRQNAIRAELEAAFRDVTKLSAPATKTDKQRKAAGAMWYGPIREIAELVGWNAERGVTLIQDTCERMMADGLAIVAPKSIVRMAASVHAESLRPPARRRDNSDPPQVTLTGTDSGFAYGEIERILERQRAEEAATCKV